jgi:hypothetical protein
MQNSTFVRTHSTGDLAVGSPHTTR